MTWLERLFRPRAALPILKSMDDAQAAAKRGDYETALAIWGPFAHAGDARAQNNIGACFAEGLGVARDPELALRWLTLSAEKGYAAGQRNLAALYFKGEGVEQNDDLALHWYRAAAGQGDAPAQDMLAWMLLERGDEADLPEVISLSRSAAEAGIASSMTRLGMLHHEALGVERSPEQAAQWWRRGAGAGDPDAEAMLGAAHLLGQGVERDGIKALALLLRAERGGSRFAPRFLKVARGSLSEDEIACAAELAG